MIRRVERCKVGGAPRLFVDVTTSLMLAEQAPMGISRVEGELVRRLLASTKFHTIPIVFRSDGLPLALSSEQVECIFQAAAPAHESTDFFASQNERREIEGASLQKSTKVPGKSKAAIRAFLVANTKRLATKMVAYAPLNTRGDLRAILVHAREIARKSRPGGSRSANTKFSYRPPVAPEISTVLLRDRIFPHLRAVVHFQEGDLLLTAGLYRNFVPLRQIGEVRRRTGLKVATVLYDLIRVDYPQFNPASMGVELFKADIVAQLDASDVMFSISEWSRGQLQTFAAGINRPAPDIRVIPPASNLVEQKHLFEKEDVSLPLKLGGRRFALSVGTVEPRKNYALLVRVWEKLAKDPEFQMDLVIVGKLGFESEASLSELTSSPLFGNRIHWFKDCPDQILGGLYKMCHVFVYPTFVEGWGLPITEALIYGRPVIASNCGAIPEAARGHASLLDPNDEEAWTNAIVRSGKGPRTEVAFNDPPTWQGGVAQIEEELLQLAGRR